MLYTTLIQIRLVKRRFEFVFNAPVARQLKKSLVNVKRIFPIIF